MRDLMPDSRTDSGTRPYRVAYLVSHPIQYQAPLLRLMASDPQIELTAFFLSDFSLRDYHDRGFGTRVDWDVPLLDGYKAVFLPSIGGNGFRPPLRPVSYGLTRSFRAGRFDALWLHGYSHLVNLRALLVARRLGMKILVRTDAHLGSLVGGRAARSVKNRLLPPLFRLVDAFLAGGTLNAQYFAHHGVPQDKIWLLPYAVDNAYFQEQARLARPARETLRAELGLESGRPVILFASKFLPRKRAVDLLAAYTRLSPDGRAEPTPYLLFVGDGAERPALEAGIRATGWSSAKLLGVKSQAELARYLDLCDVFVLPSENEPWGLVVNEAMNVGRAVVVTDEVGAGPDLVGDGDNGFIVPARDVLTLADRLHRLCADDALRQRMGARGLARVRQWGFAEDLSALHDALRSTIGPPQGAERPSLTPQDTL